MVETVTKMIESEGLISLTPAQQGWQQLLRSKQD